MSRQYPIWHEVQSCHYQSNKSFGGKSNSRDKISVGSSSKNTHELVDTQTTRRVFWNQELQSDVVSFVYFVDGQPIKGIMFKADGEKAKGEAIATFNYVQHKEIDWNYKE